MAFVPPITLPTAPTVPSGMGVTDAIPNQGVTVAPTPGDGFADALTSAVDELQATQTKSDNLAIQAASGDLRDVHDYMIAATEAQLATSMVTTIRNRGVEAFNEIMRMPV